MGFRINTNVASIRATNALTNTNSRLGTSYNRLSTGLRINSAADDAAGLGVSESLRTEIRGMKQAQRNANDAVSIVQVAEGTLSEIQSNLQRLRELAVQASSGTLDNDERAYIDTESDELISEISRLAESSEFNGINLLGDANTTQLVVQVGSGTSTINDQMTLNFSSSDATGLALTGIDMSSEANALTAITTLDTALGSVSTQRGQLGAYQNRLTSTISALGNSIENLSAAESQVRDVDFATETAEMSRNQVLQQSGISVLAQANSSAQSVLKLIG